MTSSCPTTCKIPILLLKTRSQPNDGYEEYFSHPASPFTPVFVPVLEHRPNQGNLNVIGKLVSGPRLAAADRTEELLLGGKYGGIVFTSQRAVEGFAGVIEEEVKRRGTELDRGCADEDAQLESQTWSPPASRITSTTDPFPLYTVGPATARTLTTLLSPSRTTSSGSSSHSDSDPLSLPPPLHRSQVLGSHTGTGDALATYITTHYRSLYPSSPTPPLLFLVGETRRDVIPKTLAAERITVDEVVVYETGVVDSFATDLEREVRRVVDTGEDKEKEKQKKKEPRLDGITATSRERAKSATVVIVIFSPTGCHHVLGLLDRIQTEHSPPTLPSSSSSSASPPPPPSKKPHSIILATIGPTTRAHLRDNFSGSDPDVVADKPSPEGVALALARHLGLENWTGF